MREKTLLQEAINATCGDSCAIRCTIKFAERMGSKVEITQVQNNIRNTAADAIISSRTRD